MTPPLSLTLWSLASLALLGLPLYSWRVRGRGYAIFVFVVLALSLPGALITHARLAALAPTWTRAPLDAAFAYGVGAAGIHLVALVVPRLRTAQFRLAVSIPAMVFLAAGALCGGWLLLLLPIRVVLVIAGLEAPLAALAWLDVVPLLVAVASVITSTRTVEEIVQVPLAATGPDVVTRVPVARYRPRTARPSPATGATLRVVQITDTHLGPWQPVRKLQEHIERLIAHDPDLVLLTGDFLTMEGGGTPGALAEAFLPLRQLPGRCFGIFGNHDHAYPDEVRRAFRAVGATLLVDDQVSVETRSGTVQIIGADYVGRGRREHIRTLLAAHPRREGVLRLLLLHDPLGFRHVPPGAADLTISGHTHGGQVGLVSLGMEWTVLSRSRWPDHGLFGHGPNRLYVHRGTGFYGFPLRVGVPGEASVLEILPHQARG
jgi:hypothetical protein